MLKTIDMLPKRKQIRLRNHDYSGGLYFITACTHNKIHFFGEINNCKMQLSSIGEKLIGILDRFNNPDSEFVIWSHCVMPNHFHALIEINNSEPQNDNLVCPTTRGDKRTRLSVFVGEIKAIITKYARNNGCLDFKWQSKYNDHIVRDIHECNLITEYIENNVYRWGNDTLYSPIGLIHR